MPASIAWWGWLLIAGVCWYVQMMIDVWADRAPAMTNFIRIVCVCGMVLCGLIGVIRFVKWVWVAI